ncbi:Annexin repeat [Dillenia turbinata]|uniref:Annexin repeat n=1 Tax=Dillenia turbinata TaxID=194707 RepID=A0AAN8VQ05_9MAGN
MGKKMWEICEPPEDHGLLNLTFFGIKICMKPYNLEDVIVYKSDARLANEALKARKKSIKDLQVLVEIACASLPHHLMVVRQAYCYLIGIPQLLIGLVSSYRHDKDWVDMNVAKLEALHLNEAIEGKQLDHDDVVRILSTKNIYQLRATFDFYKEYSKEAPIIRTSLERAGINACIGNYIMFDLSLWKIIHPHNLLRSPESYVVTMQAQKETPPNMQCRDKFLLQSVIAPNGATSKGYYTGHGCMNGIWCINFMLGSSLYLSICRLIPPTLMLRMTKDMALNRVKKSSCLTSDTGNVFGCG